MLLSLSLVSSLSLLLLDTRAQNTGEPINYDDAHNITSLTGTWSTGAMHVITGPNFADPNQQRFKYPSTAGVSVSFTDSGWYEYAQYSFVANGTDPTCITGYLLWQHGHYSTEANGTLFLHPIAGDGYQQVQKSCAAVSNLIEANDDTIEVNWWTITTGLSQGYVLTMQKFDGTYYAPFGQYSTSPEMLPTQQLRNVNATAQAQASEVSARDVEEERSARGWAMWRW